MNAASEKKSCTNGITAVIVYENLREEDIILIEQAWILQLKEEFNELDQPQYYTDEGDDVLNLTDDLQKAERYENKEVAEHWMKRWEEVIFEKFGEGAICNAGYTNMMKHFEWVEIEVEVVE